MVATSLPFWMHQSSRVMLPFPDQSALRAGPLAADTSPRAATAGPAAVTVDFCDAQAILAHEQAWGALAARALEPNVFLEPGFALPALRHFPPTQWPSFLLVWSTESTGHVTLLGLCALRPLLATFGPKVTTAWIHDQATASAPLLDRDRAGEALDLMLDWLGRQAPDWSGLVLQGVALDGPLARLLADRAPGTIELERRERVVLRRPAVSAVATPAPAGHAKELRRQRRRLADLGTCTYRSASGVDEVRAAVERFLDLEARGWKGRRGTALLNDAGLAAFTRAMTRRLARAGLCRVDMLEVDGEPAAMGLVLRSGDRAFYWKTSYDERWGRHSPGKLLADRLAATQRADPGIALTDSCAVPNHAMIGHVWGDRMIVADLLVAGPAVNPALLARAARAIHLRRRCRGAAKGAFHRLRRAVARFA